MNNTGLLPCPLCGSDAVIQKRIGAAVRNGYNVYRVYCSKCGVIQCNIVQREVFFRERRNNDMEQEAKNG